MIYRANQAILALASCLLLAGFWAAAGVRFWEAEQIIRVGRLAGVWMLLMVLLGMTPVVTWSVSGVARLFRRRRIFRGTAAAAALLVVSMNLLFWGLVQAQFAPVQRLFERGRVVWVGERALLFGHGYWKVSDGYWQHQTVIRLRDGTIYRGPTLDLLATLRENGASAVWGSWCYTGNYPYIRKDLVSGEEIPWPSYASYNKAPGMTIPIWVGTAFVRVGWPMARYTNEPETVGPVVPDTLTLGHPSTHRIEQAFTLMQQRVRGLPRPDSVSWQPIEPDTVYSVSRTEYLALSTEERYALRERESDRLARKARTGLALYWIRGRGFPVYIRVPARLHRPLEPQLYADNEDAPRRSVGG